MSNPIVDGLIQQLLDGTLQAATTAGVASLDKAKDAAKDYLQEAVPDVERWVQSMVMSPPMLTPDELKTLLTDLGWLAILHALTIAGMVEIEIDKTKDVLLKIAAGIASTAVGKLIGA